MGFAKQFRPQVNVADLKELSQGNVIKAVRAVEHDTLLSHSFGQIFSRLGLSCTCWAFWGSS